MTDLPPAPAGALVYTHPQGKTIYVLSDGNMVCYKPDGKRGTSSATPEKLAAGHGGWELVQGTPRTCCPGGPHAGHQAWCASPEAQALVTTGATAPSPYGLAPQLAEEAEVATLPTLVTDSRRVGEQKLDGDRVLVRSDGKAFTRDGRPYTKGLPSGFRHLCLPEGNWTLDGELVTGPKGRTYWAFDLVDSNALDDPLDVRRAALEDFVARYGDDVIRLVPQARTLDEKHALARTAIENNFEGLMFKRRDGRYRSGGRTLDWVKVKFTKTADVVVMPKKKDDGHNSAAYGVYDGDRLVEVGKASLNGKEKRYAIEEGDVLEVKYLYTGANGRLYQPRILRKRSDKRPDECTIDQLVHVNKKVLEAIE